MSRWSYSLALVLVGCWPSLSQGENWPSLRGPNQNGISSAPLVLSDAGPQELWRAKGPGGNGGIIVDAGHAYSYGTGPINMICLDLETGKDLWSKTNFPEWHGNLTPTISDGKMYLQSYTHDHPQAHCIDAETGDELWKRQLPKPQDKRPYGHAGSPLLVGDVVYLNAGGGVALKQSTGQVVWEFDGLPGLATPVLYNHRAARSIVFFLGDAIISRELTSGREQWRIPWKTDLAVNAHHPLLIDQNVLINSDYGMGRAMYDVSVNPPREKWKYDRGSGHAYAASILHDGYVYGFFEHSLACLDPSDGALRWKAKPNSGALLLIDNQLVCLSGNGVLSVGPISKDRWNPTLESRIHTGATRNNPAYIDGKLLVKNDKGEIVCVRIGSS